MQTETLTRMRIIFLITLSLAFLTSQLASLSFAETVTNLSEPTLDLIDNIGFATMLLTVLTGGWILTSAQRRDSRLKDALNDELVQHNFRMAAVFGFKLVFILSLGLFILAKLTPIDGEDIARIILTACLVGSYLRFAYLESRSA